VSRRLPAATALVLAVVLVPSAAALRFTDDSAEIAEPRGELLAATRRLEEFERAEP
jgi:hypothetical protein